jgi:hypothetical protein
MSAQRPLVSMMAACVYPCHHGRAQDGGLALGTTEGTERAWPGGQEATLLGQWTRTAVLEWDPGPVGRKPASNTAFQK